MHVDVNGTRLWFYVDRPALVPDGRYVKPDFGRLAELAPARDGARPPTRQRRSAETARALPEGIAPLEVVAGAGHVTWLDAPDRFWPMIIEFHSSATGRR
jgi:hypothetical protein